MTTDSNADSAQPATLNRDAGVAVQVTGLSLHADGRPLLVNASALFPAGNVSLIVGCSGVGKSLLLKILAGLIDRNEGAITWSGQILRNLQPRSQQKSHLSLLSSRTTHYSTNFRHPKMLRLRLIMRQRNTVHGVRFVNERLDC
jgi:ABC-type transport system involved in cytochrome bd biosynthesis fused ATPase/permease subunit